MTKEETSSERQERLRQLALLCLEKREFTDDELMRINASGKELYRYLESRGLFAVSGAQQLLRARAIRAELSKLHTEELERKVSDIRRNHAEFLRLHEDDDDLGDSAFEGPYIDS